MATKSGFGLDSGKSLKEDITNELECGICLEQYNDPKVLDCLHTFCCKCLQGCLKDGEISCPICRRQTQVTSGDVSLLKSNFFISSLIDVLDFHAEATKVKCNGCEGVDAFKFCTECKRFLCKSCLASHQQFVEQFKLADTHLLLTPDAALSQKKLSEKEKHCMKHKNELITLFCEDCEDTICRNCALVEHKTHAFVFISEAHENYRDSTERRLNNAMHIISETSAKSFEDKMTEITELGESCKQKVIDKFNRITELVTCQRDKLLSSISTNTETLITQLRRQIEELDTVKSSAASIVDILQKWEGIELFGISKQLAEQITEIEKLKINTNLLNGTYTIEEVQGHEKTISTHIESLFQLSDVKYHSVQAGTKYSSVVSKWRIQRKF